MERTRSIFGLSDCKSHGRAILEFAVQLPEECRLWYLIGQFFGDFPLIVPTSQFHPFIVKHAMYEDGPEHVIAIAAVAFSRDQEDVPEELWEQPELVGPFVLTPYLSNGIGGDLVHQCMRTFTGQWWHRCDGREYWSQWLTEVHGFTVPAVSTERRRRTPTPARLEAVLA